MDFLFGDQNKREIKEYEKIISKILEHKKVIVSLSNEELKEKTNEFKNRLNSGESLEDILPEAFAVAREASRRFLGKEQREVQLMGALALHNGDVAEMKTGEGKTLTAPIAAYLNALTGKGVHIATSNDYLASRDANDLRPMYEGLGLSVGVVTGKRLSDGIENSEEKKQKIKEDLELRKEAYRCDITYGSSNAFAFDYLRDNTAKNIDGVVRGEQAGFIIIDEADQILVNDAVMPFKLSGMITETSEKTFIEQLMEIKRKQHEKNLKEIDRHANYFVHKLFKDKEHIKEFKQIESLKLRMGQDKEKTSAAQREYSVLFCKSIEASLTERGWLEAFRYFEANNFINENPSIIINNPNMVLDKDYYMDSGQVFITLEGLEKAVKTIPVIRDLNNEFYNSSKFDDIRTSIDNSLKAYFVLEHGKEYMLADSMDTDGKLKKKVLLVSNGRLEEGRAYSGGLQQAIELKEKRLNPTHEFISTKEHDELGSISQKAFYSIYPKMSGMTGTSSKELFENVYGMNTISIPKHTEYNVKYEDILRIYKGRIDKDTVLFETDKEKMEAVIASVLESHKKGQPVLIGTLSINDSNKLYEEFIRRGIPCEKLNAENAELEGEIISRAGKKGAITISTQMAGRGTDIKLGGELDATIKETKEKTVEIMADKLDHKIPMETRRSYALQYVENKGMDAIIYQATNSVEKERQELIEAGGLKVIGYGHYPTKRDDDQLRGRAARQDEPGITEFYASLNDLKKNLLVPGSKVASLRKIIKEKGPLNGEIVDKVISNAQANREGLLTNLIVSTQEVERHLSIMRKSIYEQRTRMLQGEDIKANMEFIIDSSVVNLIDRNLPQYSMGLNHHTKIAKSGLNINNFIIDVEETFGFDLTDDFNNNEFKTLGDIEKRLSDKAKEQYNVNREKNGKHDENDRTNIVETIDRAWRSFNEDLDYIKFQGKMHSLAQNKDYDEVLVMRKGFNQAMKDAKLEMLGKMFGKASTKTKDVEEEKTYEEDIDNLNDYSVSEKKSYTNLNVRTPKIITALSNKITLIKGLIMGEKRIVTNSNTSEIDTIQKIEFDSSEVTHSSSKK